MKKHLDAIFDDIYSEVTLMHEELAELEKVIEDAKEDGEATTIMHQRLAVLKQGLDGARFTLDLILGGKRIPKNDPSAS